MKSIILILHANYFESTNVQNTTQLAVFIRNHVYIKLWEKLLEIIQMFGMTSRYIWHSRYILDGTADIFYSFMKFLAERSLLVKK